MRGGRKGGFTIFEFLVLIAFFGFLIVPVIVFVSSMKELTTDVEISARVSTLKAAQDQAIVSGVDTLTAPFFNQSSEEGGFSASVGYGNDASLERISSSPSEGRAAITAMVLTREFDSKIDGRPASIGFELGAGPKVPDREGIPSFSVPVLFAIPSFNHGLVGEIDLSVLSPVSSGPYVTSLTASSAHPLARVVINENTTANGASGARLASLSVDATNLLSRVSGVFWAELDPSSVIGALAFPTGDGRTMYRVPDGDGYINYYPSPISSYNLGLRLPAPELTVGGTSVPSGSSLSITWDEYQAVASGGDSAFVGYSNSVVRAFGGTGAFRSLGINYAMSFQRNPSGSSDGNLAAFFSNSFQGYWEHRNELLVTPSGGGIGTSFELGRWNIVTDRVQLDPPELVNRPSSVASGYDIWDEGPVTYRVPYVDGKPVGWLSFRDNLGGQYKSTGESLKMNVTND